MGRDFHGVGTRKPTGSSYLSLDDIDMADEDYLEHNHLDETYELEDSDKELSFGQEIIMALKANDNKALS